MSRSSRFRMIPGASRPALGLALVLGALLGVAPGLVACGDDDGHDQPDAGPAVLHHVGAAELHGWLEAKDFLLINVHVPNAGEITGTDTHIVYSDTDALAAYIGSDLDAKVVLYCLTDGMTSVAGPALVERGYRQIYVLDGGMNAWTAAGYTLDP